jgi:hypothetical protein
MSGKAIVNSIERNVAQLISENRKLRGEVERLTASRDRLREENRRLATDFSEVERRLVVKELAAGFGSNTKIARARVNRLLREVDKCIGLLRMKNEE